MGANSGLAETVTGKESSAIRLRLMPVIVARGKESTLRSHKRRSFSAVMEIVISASLFRVNFWLTTGQPISSHPKFTTASHAKRLSGSGRTSKDMDKRNMEDQESSYALNAHSRLIGKKH